MRGGASCEDGEIRRVQVTHLKAWASGVGDGGGDAWATVGGGG